MQEPYSDTGTSLSAGDFRKSIDFLDGDVEISVGCEGLKLRSGLKRSTVIFTDANPTPLTSLDEKTWILEHDCLMSIAKLISEDVGYWESLVACIELNLEHYEGRKLPRHADWKAREDLWYCDPVYRKMRSEHDKAKCHIPSFGCFLYPDKIEFYLSHNDFADVATIAIMSKTACGSE